MTTTPEPMLDYVLRNLEASRGLHAKIAQETGVPYHTIKNVSQGKAKDPRASTLQKLHDYFREREADKAAEEGADAPNASNTTH